MNREFEMLSNVTHDFLAKKRGGGGGGEKKKKKKFEQARVYSIREHQLVGENK